MPEMKFELDICCPMTNCVTLGMKIKLNVSEKLYYCLTFLLLMPICKENKLLLFKITKVFYGNINNSYHYAEN